MAEAKRLVLSMLLIALLAVHCAETYADIGGRAHSRGVIFSARSRLGCTFCHPKIADTAVWSVDGLGLFETYRCLACHAGVSKTLSHYQEIASGPHASLGCLYCHQVYHEGHRQGNGYYEGFRPRTYGCGCHNIASNTWDMPLGADRAYSFTVTYYVDITATALADLARKDLFYGDTFRGVRGTFVMAFMNPYTGYYGQYDVSQRNLTCLHCHFTNVGPASWDTTTSHIYRHPGECAMCHSKLVTATSGFPSSASAKAHTVDHAHKAYDVYCDRCHGLLGYISQSVHARIGCRCHSLIHISRYNSTASWVTLMATPPGTYYAFKDTNIDWNQWRIVFRYTPFNNTAFCIWFKPELPEDRYYPDFYGGAEPCVPVYAILQDGVVKYSGITYAMRDGKILANTTSREFFGSRWLICYNCHLINMPGGLSLGKGSIPISIDLTSLAFMDPHALKPARRLPLYDRGLDSVGGDSALSLPLDASVATVVLALVAYLALVMRALRYKSQGGGG